MQSVDAIARDIVAREGGFVDDPDDPGGATKHGVTVHTLRRLGLDLDGDGGVDAADVRLVDADRAADIFKKHYFEAPGIGRLPDAVQPSAFDMYVNAGANAVKILQRLLGAFGEPVSVDGVIGPRTAAAASLVQAKAPRHLADAYGIERRNYYYALADARPQMRKFARRRDGGKGGWIVRAEAFFAPRFHFTEAQHRERTAAWD